MTVEVELDGSLPADDGFRAKTAGEVRAHIKAMAGVTCEIALKAPGEIPRSQGKAVRVKDLRRDGKP